MTKTNDGLYRLSHQQAHIDAMTTLPTWPWTFWDAARPAPDPLPLGVPLAQNLVDTDLNNEKKLRWWTFANHNEHYVGQTVMPQYSLFPFW